MSGDRDVKAATSPLNKLPDQTNPHQMLSDCCKQPLVLLEPRHGNEQRTKEQSCAGIHR